MKVLAVLISLLLVVLIGAGVAWPFVLADFCPACFGFTNMATGVYIERGATTAQRAFVLTTVAEARARLDRFYGDRRGLARIFICEDQPCYGRIGGGGSRGMALFDWALFLSPRGTTPVIAAHELSHIELHARLGLLKTYRRSVPQWFDEGVAVLVSDDPRYLRPPADADRCMVQPDGPLPASRQAWVENAANADLYAKAACTVDRWVNANGGPSAVMGLLNKMAAGASFDDAYRFPRP
jgi:hypothetical protein